MPCGGGFRPVLANLLTVGGQSQTADERSPHLGDDRTHCPECGLEITDEFSWCPRCGNRLKPHQCDYCKGNLPKGAVDCPRCGAPVGLA